MDDTDRHAETVRHEILRHAEDLFRHYGFAKTNIADIAERCGMSAGNLYRYFRNKQAIGLACVQNFFALSEAGMAEAIEIPGSPEARIRRMIEAGVGHLVSEMDKNPKMVELAEFLCSNDEGLATLDAHIVWRRARIAAVLEEGRAAGDFSFDDAAETARTLQFAVKAFWMPFSLAQWRDKSTVLPELRMVLDLVFQGLRHR